MKWVKWVIGISISIMFSIAVLFVINNYEDKDKIIEKHPDISQLLSFIRQNKNDTVIVSDFNDLYRRFFLSKINDSIISFCRLNYNGGSDYMLIISPDSISIFESPDYDAHITMLDLIVNHEGYTNKTNPMFKKIEQELDLIFTQEQIKFYRFIGFIKVKPNRVIFIDNFYGFFSTGAFCHTRTVKNDILNPLNWKFFNDRPDVKEIIWRLPFPDNMVPKDSILKRIRRVRACKDSIKRWIINIE